MCCCCQDQSCCCKKNRCACCASTKQSCGCSTKTCGCGTCGDCSGQCGCKKCHIANKFFELADCAWMEVLKEKIKENIKSSAKNLDELARMISEANHERWQKKMENKICTGSFEEKLSEFFGQSCRTKQGNSKNR
jgi:hypothetical protein